jgi:hypothetical protein
MTWCWDLGTPEAEPRKRTKSGNPSSRSERAERSWRTSLTATNNSELGGGPKRECEVCRTDHGWLGGVSGESADCPRCLGHGAECWVKRMARTFEKEGLYSFRVRRPRHDARGAVGAYACENSLQRPTTSNATAVRTMSSRWPSDLTFAHSGFCG